MTALSWRRRSVWARSDHGLLAVTLANLWCVFVDGVVLSSGLARGALSARRRAEIEFRRVGKRLD